MNSLPIKKLAFFKKNLVVFFLIKLFSLAQGSVIFFDTGGLRNDFLEVKNWGQFNPTFEVQGSGNGALQNTPF